MNAKRILLILLTLCLLIPLAACGDENVTDVTDTEEATTEAVKALGPLLIKDGALAFSIIRSSDASQALVTEASKLNKLLREIVGGQTSFSEDFITRNTADNDNPEILIGATNRPESSEKLKELSTGDWFVGMSGPKILIIGGNDNSTVEAVEYFIECINSAFEAVDEAGKAAVTLDFLTEDKVYKKEYSSRVIQIAGTSLSEYSIHYASDSDCISLKSTLISTISDVCGVELASIPSTKTAENNREICIGTVAKRELSSTFDKELSGTLPYSVNCREGILYLNGKGLWGLTAAVNVFIDSIQNGTDIPEGFSKSGDAYGTAIFGLTEGADIRIMSNNVWKCDSNQTAWKEKGEDCSAASRAPALAAYYIAFKPDIINFQEMSNVMITLILKEMSNAGLNYKKLTAYPTEADDTPIVYNADTLKMIDNGHHLYSYGNNGNSKGYHWALFEHKATGTRFLDLSTHLWWKSESAEPGSDSYRERQANEIVALSEKLIAQYNCPMVIQGDLNTTTGTQAYKNLLNGNFVDCQKIAVSADNTRGHHQCSPEGYSTSLYSGNYSDTAIDHTLIKNRGDWKILCFRQTTVDFYWRLSDHIPMYIDVQFN